MARFNPHRIPFGRRPAVDDDSDAAGCDLPRPRLLRLQAIRAAKIKEASEVLSVLPAPGEMLAVQVTHRLDMTDVLAALLERLGRCEKLIVATLGYNRRNLKQMLGWLDSGQVGSLTLLASIFFRSHNGDLWTETVEGLRRRGCRCACAASHAKVSVLEFSSGERLVTAGSGNLCANGSAIEAFDCIHSADLCSWHSAWIEEMVNRAPQADKNSG